MLVYHRTHKHPTLSHFPAQDTFSYQAYVSSLNYFVLKTLQVRVRISPPDVLSSVKKIKTSI